MTVDEMDARYLRRDEMQALLNVFVEEARTLRNVFMEEARNGFAKLEKTFNTSFSSAESHLDAMEERMNERLDQTNKRLDRIEELVGIDKTRH